jgi:S-disulfanyl-L-cysteine oxidoreductase SoxD
MPRRALLLLLALTFACAAAAQTRQDPRLGLGSPASEADLAKFFAVPPDGRGLPAGSGTPEQGVKVYADTCAACHGEKLEGNLAKGIGGDKLIGGRGTLASGMPVKTVESYWPYATTLFDYVKRTMPFNAPGSLTDDQVYAVAAYILSQGNIIGKSDVMNAQTLPKVAMPNRDGFIPDPRPEVQLYR